MTTRKKWERIYRQKWPKWVGGRGRPVVLASPSAKVVGEHPVPTDSKRPDIVLTQEGGRIELRRKGESESPQ